MFQKKVISIYGINLSYLGFWYKHTDAKIVQETDPSIGIRENLT